MTVTLYMVVMIGEDSSVADIHQRPGGPGWPGSRWSRADVHSERGVGGGEINCIYVAINILLTKSSSIYSIVITLHQLMSSNTRFLYINFPEMLQ
jgi:hypothetical protein